MATGANHDESRPWWKSLLAGSGHFWLAQARSRAKIGRQSNLATMSTPGRITVRVAIAKSLVVRVELQSKRRPWAGIVSSRRRLARVYYRIRPAEGSCTRIGTTAGDLRPLGISPAWQIQKVAQGVQRVDTSPTRWGVWEPANMV